LTLAQKILAAHAGKRSVQPGEFARGQTFKAAPFPVFIRELVPAGGLVEYASRLLTRPPEPKEPIRK
jgi:hypothetical protein